MSVTGTEHKQKRGLQACRSQSPNAPLPPPHALDPAVGAVNCQRARGAWTNEPLASSSLADKMTLNPEKAKAVLARMGGKKRSRRGPHRPAVWLGQFSLAALLLFITVASMLLAISHYQGPQIIRHLDERTQIVARTFPDTPADKFVPVVVGLVSVTLGIVTGCLVYRMRADRGIYVVFLLASLAVLGLIVAWSLPIRPLTETKLQYLLVNQLIPISLAGLCTLLPLGSAVGWYARFASTEA